MHLPYSLAELDAAIVELLGPTAVLQHRASDGSLYWSDALFACSHKSFVIRRGEDRASEIVRHAITTLDDDLELPSSLR